MKEIRIQRRSIEIVVELRPVIEYKMVRTIQGLEAKELNSIPMYFGSEEAIVSYLTDCGESFRIVDDGKTYEEPTDDLSEYARLYEQGCSEWHNNSEYNRLFIQAQEKFQNHRLKQHGYVFLNDVYESLGFSKTSQGQIVGWLLNSEDGDGYIDFGIFHPRNTEFNNGLGVNCWLDFNVDGVIYEKI